MRTGFCGNAAVRRSRVGLLWSNKGFSTISSVIAMGNKIVTEADRKATPRPTPMPGMALPTPGRGQRRSLERGVATRFKKNPGKRTKKGG